MEALFIAGFFMAAVTMIPAAFRHDSEAEYEEYWAEQQAEARNSDRRAS
ncbi:hypothetical protein [Pseudarthrobacter sp. PS3-L1]|nr:hypothetical protein [Pseudarthrobacter sp. PS3-L1]MDJ0319786.1 hypothetical protein [Pseudarthrobacter sp. PS3-L1]